MRNWIVALLLLATTGILPASAQKVRVMTYNVRNGRGVDDVKSIERCTDVIRSAGPDVVAIQEVDSMTSRNNYYVLGRMAELTGYHAYFGPTIPYKGGKYGIGILSKRKALSVAFYPLPNSVEARGLLVVEYDKYYMLCTHLSGVASTKQRDVQVAIIREVVSRLNKPTFIAGDMNARPTWATMVAFKEFATVLSDENIYTAPSQSPSKCIDYVLGANGSFEVLNRYIYHECLASDHLPLYVDVKVCKAKKKKDKQKQ